MPATAYERGVRKGTEKEQPGAPEEEMLEDSTKGKNVPAKALAPASAREKAARTWVAVWSAETPPLPRTRCVPMMMYARTTKK